MLELELDFTTPECHLCLIGKHRGILGHPKCFYDTMLNLNEDAVLKANFSEEYDPYGLVRHAFIDTKIPADDVLTRYSLSKVKQYGNDGSLIKQTFSPLFSLTLSCTYY